MKGGLRNVVEHHRFARGQRLTMSAVTCLLMTATTFAANLPHSLNLDTVREISLQTDGRWPPLDTVARDVVESVTGDMFFEGHDPVLLLLAWTIDGPAWMNTPLIKIGNAELRSELQLPPDRTVFSFAELVNHKPLNDQIDALMHRGGSRKMNPLESKVSGIHEKLNILNAAFLGYSITPIPDPNDARGAWFSIAEMKKADSAQYAKLREAWGALEHAFRADDAAAFNQASSDVTSALKALPAQYRPSEHRIALELRSNQLHPFRTSWQIMVVGALLSAIAFALRRRVLDVLAAIAMIAGFAVLTYGMYLRWQVAGRIPASNMFESLLFLSWGMGAFAILSMLIVRDRTVPLTASAMGALALFLADVLPLDSFIRPIPPVLCDTIWMSIHVPIIMVSYSVLALAMLIAHAQVVVMAVAPNRRSWSDAIDQTHYWYVHVGTILLLVGIATGSMWGASSWGRYWGWDPKEVWSLIALLAYLAILHVRIDRQHLPVWARVIGGLMLAALLVVIVPKLAPLSGAKVAAFGGTVAIVGYFVSAHGAFATAVKSIVAFWTIIMTYLGVNYVLGIGLHSYGFGTGAVVRYMFLTGGIDLAIVVLCGAIYLVRRRPSDSSNARRGIPVVMGL